MKEWFENSELMDKKTSFKKKNIPKNPFCEMEEMHIFSSASCIIRK